MTSDPEFLALGLRLTRVKLSWLRSPDTPPGATWLIDKKTQ